MCECTRSSQVRAIGVICTILTALSALNLVKIVVTGDVGYEFQSFYSSNYILALSIQSVIYSIHIITYILLIFASIKHNKIVLIPFLFITTIQIILLILIATYFVYLFTFLYLVLLIPVFTVLGLTMYILVTVIQFYREISKANSSIERPSIILLQPYNNNHHQSIFQGRTRPLGVYIPPSTQTSQYTYQQEQYNPEYTQQFGYSTGKYSNLDTEFWKWKHRQGDITK